MDSRHLSRMVDSKLYKLRDMLKVLTALLSDCKVTQLTEYLHYLGWRLELNVPYIALNIKILRQLQGPVVRSPDKLSTG